MRYLVDILNIMLSNNLDFFIFLKDKLTMLSLIFSPLNTEDLSC